MSSRLSCLLGFCFFVARLSLRKLPLRRHLTLLPKKQKKHSLPPPPRLQFSSHQTPPKSGKSSILASTGGASNHNHSNNASNPGTVQGSGFTFNTNSLYSSLDKEKVRPAATSKGSVLTDLANDGGSRGAGVSTVGFPAPVVPQHGFAVEGSNSNSMSHSSFHKDQTSLPLHAVHSALDEHLKKVAAVDATESVQETPPETSRRKRKSAVPKKYDKSAMKRPKDEANPAKVHLGFPSPDEASLDDKKKGRGSTNSKVSKSDGDDDGDSDSGLLDNKT